MAEMALCGHMKYLVMGTVFDYGELEDEIEPGFAVKGIATRGKGKIAVEIYWSGAGERSFPRIVHEAGHGWSIARNYLYNRNEEVIVRMWAGIVNNYMLRTDPSLGFTRMPTSYVDVLNVVAGIPHYNKLSGGVLEWQKSYVPEASY